MLLKKLAYLVLLVLLWIMMVMYSFRVTAVIFYTFLILPLPLCCILKWQARKVDVRLVLPDRIVEKKKLFRAGIVVENKNRLPVGRLKLVLAYRNTRTAGCRKKKIEFPLVRGTRKYFLTIGSDYSACLEFQIRSARLFDVLGIFSSEKIRRRSRGRNTEPDEVIVLPQLHEMEASPVRPNPYVLVESDLYSDRTAGDDPAELFDIREYVQGDRLNRIHWKLSAKSDQFMVKEFGQPVDCSVLILVDFGSSRHGVGPEYEDAVREAALSLSFQMLKEQQTHLFAWYDAAEGTNVRYRISDIEEFYDMAGCLIKSGKAWKGRRRKKDAEGKGADTAFFYFSEFDREQYTNIFYVTADKSPVKAARFLMECRKSAWLRLVFLNGHPSGEELGLPVEGVLKDDLSTQDLGRGLAMMAYGSGGAAWDGE